MKKLLSVFMSFVIISLTVFCVPFTAKAATYTPNVKIYADYTIQSFKVSFYTDETMTELFKEYNLEFESEIPDPGTPVKEGYTFIGWDPDLVGSAMPAEDTAAYAV